MSYVGCSLSACSLKKPRLDLQINVNITKSFRTKRFPGNCSWWSHRRTGENILGGGAELKLAENFAS